jgi:hypothetical protein
LLEEGLMGLMWGAISLLAIFRQISLRSQERNFHDIHLSEVCKGAPLGTFI